jgi:hypothetical protein
MEWCVERWNTPNCRVYSSFKVLKFKSSGLTVSAIYVYCCPGESEILPMQLVYILMDSL